MLNFTFNAPTTIHFGKTKTPLIEGELRNRAQKLLIVSGRGSVKKNGIYDDVMRYVNKAGIPYWELDGIKPNPHVSSVYTGIRLCREQSIDFILAIGGGSVIDAAKAIAAGACYDGDVWDFFATHTGPKSALPVGCVLTLAGTGSEMNGNAVITKEETKEKRACSSPVLIPVFSLLNPEYSFSVDSYHTAAGVVDIMAHILEIYLSPIPHAAVQDHLAEGLLKVCIHYGPHVCKEPRNYDARANIMWASSLALNGIVGKGKITDWACHAIEHELSGLYDISHGVGLAIILPHFMHVLLKPHTAANFVNFGVNVWSIQASRDPLTIAHEAITRTQDFFTSLGLPSRLTAVDINDEHFIYIARTVMQIRGKVGHYEQLSEDDILKVLTLSL